MNMDDLHRVQQIETEMLFDAADLCERHNIPYFLLYGTLLGAVRHQGTIPWDDDVDIGIPRKYYQQFLDIAKKELDQRNQLYVMGAGIVSVIKIGRKNTLFCMKGSEEFDIMKNAHVDVFILDYIKTKSALNQKISDALAQFLYICKQPWDEKKLMMHIMDQKKKKGRFVYKIGLNVMHGLRFVFGGERGIESILYKMYVDQRGTSGQWGVVQSRGKTKLPADCGTCSLMYEGRMLSAPSCYDKLLTSSYGDYMTYPPEAERYSYLDSWIFSEQ